MLQKIGKYIFYAGLALVIGGVSVGGIPIEGATQGVQLGLGLAGAIVLLVAYIKKEKLK